MGDNEFEEVEKILLHSRKLSKLLDRFEKGLDRLEELLEKMDGKLSSQWSLESCRKWISEHKVWTTLGALGLGSLCTIPWLFSKKESFSQSAYKSVRKWLPTAGIAAILGTGIATGTYMATRSDKTPAASSDESSSEVSQDAPCVKKNKKSSPQVSRSVQNDSTPQNKNYLSSGYGIAVLSVAGLLVTVVICYLCRASPPSEEVDDCMA